MKWEIFIEVFSVGIEILIVPEFILPDIAKFFTGWGDATTGGHMAILADKNHRIQVVTKSLIVISL